MASCSKCGSGPFKRKKGCPRHGKRPIVQLVELNINRSNNSFRNLRESTNSQNAINAKIRNDSFTQVKGVSPVRNNNGVIYAYRADIWKDGRHIYLGKFKTINDAARARESVARALYNEFS